MRCAIEIQRGMAERNSAVPPDMLIDFRIGINLGDVIVEGEDIFGDGVNVTARLEALAEPGGICISRVVRDQIRDKLPFPFEVRRSDVVAKSADPSDGRRDKLPFKSTRFGGAPSRWDCSDFFVVPNHL